MHIRKGLCDANAYTKWLNKSWSIGYTFFHILSYAYGVSYANDYVIRFIIIAT